MEMEQKRVVVLGAGVSGLAVSRALRRAKAAVTLVDAKEPEALAAPVRALAQLGVDLCLGREEESHLAGADFLVVSPGIPLTAPYVQAARRLRLPVLSEVEVAYLLCAAPMLAVTGTNGKTTTTTLLGEMMATGGGRVAVGGNIGAGLSEEVLALGAGDVAVAEISSFQLESVASFRPRVTAVLNVTPDHLDRHGSVEAYSAVKERIFARQGADDLVVLNYDDPRTREMARRAPGRVCFFSRLEELPEGAFVRQGSLVLRWLGEEVELVSLEELRIPGAHNVENALAAAAVAYGAGAPADGIRRVLRSFAGVEHRIEPVATINGVSYYNDSKATNPESTIKALEAFPEGIVLLAGGKDKHTDLTAMMELVRDRAAHLLLFGEAAERFAAAAQAAGVAHIHRVAGVAEAVRLAQALARPAQTVLLSPACASYDQFRSYEERGRFFKQCVCKLQEAAPAAGGEQS